MQKLASNKTDENVAPSLAALVRMIVTELLAALLWCFNILV